VKGEWKTADELSNILSSIVFDQILPEAKDIACVGGQMQRSRWGSEIA